RSGSIAQRHEPEVAEVDRIAVVLQVDRPRLVLLLAAVTRLALELHLVVNGHAVVDDGGHGVGGLLAALEAGGVELDVVGLPRQGREADVDRRGRLLVEGAAIVVTAGEAEAVEDLYLVAILEIDAAVAATLPLRAGPEGEAELGVQLEVA